MQPKIINISSITLSKYHLKLLSHGTKFTPTQKGNYFDAKKFTEDFTRRIKIKHNFHNSSYNDDSYVRKKSNRPITCKDDELNQILRIIEKLEPDKSAIADNLSKEERTALFDLRDNNEIIIKEADKGGAIVIMDKEFYEKKLILNDHLNDPNTYREINPNSDHETAKKLNTLMKKHASCLTKKEMDYVTNYDWTTSEFYIRPKIHKCKSILNEIKHNLNEIINLHGIMDLVGRPIRDKKFK